MSAVDLKTGKAIWQTPTAPKGYTGGAIWSSTPAVDPKRGVVYVTTGNNYATPKEVAECQESGKRDCLPLDDHINSFVALDLKTGAIKWATRVVPFDTWNGNCFANEPGLGSARNRAAAISTLAKAPCCIPQRSMARPATSLPPGRRAACSGE